MMRYKGSVALTTLVLIIAILVGLGLSVIHTAADLGQASRAYSFSASIKILERACLEESLYQVREDSTYIGSISLPLGDGICNVTVSNSAAPNVKSVGITATQGSYRSTNIWIVDTSTTPFGISVQ